MERGSSASDLLGSGNFPHFLLLGAILTLAVALDWDFDHAGSRRGCSHPSHTKLLAYLFFVAAPVSLILPRIDSESAIQSRNAARFYHVLWMALSYH